MSTRTLPKIPVTLMLEVEQYNRLAQLSEERGGRGMSIIMRDILDAALKLGKYAPKQDAEK